MQHQPTSHFPFFLFLPVLLITDGDYYYFTKTVSTTRVLTYEHIMIIAIGIPMQCPKLRVHPAPGVHISRAGCMILGGVHPVCARFLSNLLLVYIGRVHGAISGCTILR